MVPTKNEERFHEAFVHMEHVVMGRKLARFTLKHRLWLEAMRSPLVSGGEASLLDLEMASRLCALPYGRIDAVMPPLVVRGPGFLGKWWFALRALWQRPEREYLRFQAYLLDHGCPPKTTHEVECRGEGEVPDDSPLPGLLSLVTGLLRGGMTDPEQVWCLSPGEAEWYLTGIFVHRGVDMGLVTPLDEEFLEGIAALKAEAEKKEQTESDRRDKISEKFGHLGAP